MTTCEAEKEFYRASEIVTNTCAATCPPTTVDRRPGAEMRRTSLLTAPHLPSRGLTDRTLFRVAIFIGCFPTMSSYLIVSDISLCAHSTYCCVHSCAPFLLNFRSCITAFVRSDILSCAVIALTNKILLYTPLRAHVTPHTHTHTRTYASKLV